MKALRLWLIIAVLFMTVGAIVGMFAPFLGEVLFYCGIAIPLILFVLLVLVGFAERGY